MSTGPDPYPVSPDETSAAEVLALLHQSFAYMEDRIDPPSSLHALTIVQLQQAAGSGTVWGIGHPLIACAILTPQPDCLYLGKVAIAHRARGQGLMRKLVQEAIRQASLCGRRVIRLESRIELKEVHAAFARVGFVETDRTSHAGYARPTSITMELDLQEIAR